MQFLFHCLCKCLGRENLYLASLFLSFASCSTKVLIGAKNCLVLRSKTAVHFDHYNPFVDAPGGKINIFFSFFFRFAFSKGALWCKVLFFVVFFKICIDQSSA